MVGLGGHRRNDPLKTSRTSVALSGVFCLSGATALLFETLWFRQAGLAVGNSVWATAIVLASFMAGLALGNALSARYGDRISRPIRAYAILEVLVAISGVALVWGLPELGTVLAPWFRPLMDDPLPLNALRLLVCFTLLLVPSTAMGATLPLLVKAQHDSGASFGVALGRLYGWNTLGAVIGALAGELWVIERLGLRGTGLFAASMGCAAAAAALWLARFQHPPAATSPLSAHPSELPWGVRRILGAAFVSGGLLLALEVVWFRFLSMRAASTSMVQAILLATILLGIATGGLAAGRWLRADPAAARFLSPIALLAGTFTVATYAAFHHGDRQEIVAFWVGWQRMALPALRLMLPVSFASGLLFTLLGDTAKREIPSGVRAAGLLTMWNTLGATLGALAAGFVMLPLWGMERSLFVLAVGYGVVALLTVRPAIRAQKRGILIAGGMLTLYGLHLILFPFGLMQRHYFRAMVERYAKDGSHVVALREGVNQTIAYLRRDFEDLGIPNHYRLITDGYSMSGTTMGAERYMKLFAYWPVAVHPHPRRALLISYGVGMTARALSDTAELEHIDVVDTSRDILELSRIVFPDDATHPLADPRVHVHIEDGRQFLQATPYEYDIITGEPPPPQIKGVVSLYTREYFALIRKRLASGGITTYWLPVHSLGTEDAHAIIRGFCDVFEDCSLWTGFARDWMLVGTNGAVGPVSERRFAAQWSDSRSGASLRRIGVETPEQLGSLFLADAEQLDRLTRDALPLTDDYPHRLSMRSDSAWLQEEWRGHKALMDATASQAHFEHSPTIARLWPDALRSRTLEYFETRALIDDEKAWLPPATSGLNELHDVLTKTTLRTLPLWMLGSSVRRQAAVKTASQRGLENHAYWTGLDALVDRSYDIAADAFEKAALERPGDPAPIQLRVLALALAKRTDEVRALIDGPLQSDVHEPFRAWLDQNVLGERPGGL